MVWFRMAGVVSFGRVGRGLVGRCMAGKARLVVGPVRFVLLWHGKVRQGFARQAWLVWSRRVAVRRCVVRHGRRGPVELGLGAVRWACWGKAGEARLVMERRVEARRSKAGMGLIN
jgi:hypothetical protein